MSTFIKKVWRCENDFSEFSLPFFSSEPSRAGDKSFAFARMSCAQVEEEQSFTSHFSRLS
jgi:hypothetical protein